MGFRWIGAHTDSPNLRVKPQPDSDTHGYRQLGVETYGGLLLHTWFDRDLSLAGGVVLRAPEGPRTLLLDFERPLLRVPSLAIHLCREIRTEGLKLDPQKHAVPIVGLEDVPPLRELLVVELRARDGVDARGEDVLSFDLMAYDVQPATVAGARGEFIHAARLDNPVIKHNAEQGYASDARTAALFADLCQRAGFEPQYFVSRNDIQCGSTIGPISAARVGLPTVDVGNPLLSMHSCREMAGSADVVPMIDALTLFPQDDGARAIPRATARTPRARCGSASACASLGPP